MEGRNKEVAGSTYREIKDLVFSIINNGYFDWKAPPEVEPEPVEPEIVEPVMEKSEAFQTTHMETVTVTAKVFSCSLLISRFVLGLSKHAR